MFSDDEVETDEIDEVGVDDLELFRIKEFGKNGGDIAVVVAAVVAVVVIDIVIVVVVVELDDESLFEFVKSFRVLLFVRLIGHSSLS